MTDTQATLQIPATMTLELVEHMGGQIGFESAPGAGAAFHFDLPIIGSSTVPGDTTTSSDTNQANASNP